jgi:PAS domain S-box-containing protein
MRLLLIEDNPGDVRLIAALLSTAPPPASFDIEDCPTLADGLDRLTRPSFCEPENLRTCELADVPTYDLLLLDLGLPDSQGLSTLHRARDRAPELPIIILTGLDDQEIAVQAVAAGAQDYLVKGQFDTQTLTRALRYAVERKKIELALQDREQHYRTLAETAPDFILLVGPDRTLRYANPIAARALATQSDQLVGRRISDLWPASDAERDWHNIHSVFVTGEPLHVQNVTTFAAGPLWLDTWLVPLKDARGTVRIVMALSRDITQQRQTEDALRASEKRYRELFDNSPVGIYRLTPEGRLLMANPALIRILRYPSFYELSQRSFEPRTPEPEPPVAGPEPRARETQWVRADGSLLVARENTRIVRDGAGRILYHEGTLEDITEQRLAQQRLHHLNALLRALRRVAQLIVRETDRDRLLQLTCATLVETRGYEYAWVALLQPPETEPAARERGLSTSSPSWRFVSATHAHCRDFPAILERLRQGDLPPCVAQALASPHVILREGACGQEPPARGLTSRLHHAGRTYGAIVVATPPGITPDSEEQLLLHELSNDIAHALSALETEAGRRQTQAALQQSEANFRALADNAHDGILIADADGHHLYANPAAAAITGYAVDELLRVDLGRLAAPAEVPKLRERLAARLRGESVPNQYETVVIRKDGACRDVEVSGAPTIWHSQPADLVVIRDVTERRQLDQDLRASRSRLQSTLSAIRDLVLLIAPDATISSCHAPAADLLPVPTELVTGRPYHEVLPKHVAELFAQAIADNHLGKTADFEYSLEIAGQVRWYSAKVSPIELPPEPRAPDCAAAIFLGSVAVVRDITQRRTAEDELRAGEERYRTLVELSPQAVIVHRQGRIVFANPAALALFGFQQLEQAQAKTLLDYVHPDDRDLVRDRLRQMTVAGKAVPLTQERFLAPDGSTINVEVAATPISFQNQPSILVVFRDVTEQHRVQQNLARLTRLYTVLSRINETIVRVREPRSLCQETCRIITEEGGFRMAWVGMFDLDTNQVRPVAVAGHNDGYLDVIHSAANRAHLPVTRLRIPGNSRPFIITDYETADAAIAWKRHALARGYRSSAGIPLRIVGETVGVLVVYASEPNYFDAEPLRLLESLAADLSYALETSDIETRRRAAEIELRENEQRFRGVFEHAPVGVAIVDTDQRFLQVNPALCRLLDYTAEQLIAQPYSRILAPAGRGQQTRRLVQLFRGEKSVCHGPARYQSRTGRSVLVTLSASVVRDAAGRPGYAILLVDEPGGQESTGIAPRSQGYSGEA